MAKFKVDAEKARRFLDALGASRVEDLPGGIGSFSLPPGKDPRLFRLPGTEWVEEDLVVTAAAVPDDPDFPRQWNLEKITMPKGWDIAGGGDPSVVVAVVDSGVAYRTGGGFQRAPDLAAARFVPGYDFVSGDAYPDDEYGHGTLMASMIASAYGNAYRGAGMAYRCSIMPVRVLGSDGMGYASWLAAGIRYAADHGARVISLSLAAPRHSRAVGEAVRYAYHRGAVCVAAAGNEGSDPGYPGGMDCPADEGEYVLAAGATDYLDRRAHYSNYGEGLDLVAPGGDLTRDDNGDGVPDGVPQETFRVPGNPQSGFVLFWGEGTSMAVPQVAAVAALVLSLRPKLTPSQVMELILTGCRDLGPRGWDAEHGHGLLDAASTLAAAARHRLFFAEGTTRQGFEEWLCIANPGEERATVTLEYLPGPGQGEKVTQVLEIPPLRRETVNVNQVVGPEKDVAVSVESTREVYVERAMYFDYQGRLEGGFSTRGAPFPGRYWFFAEGTTRQGFEEWLCIANPGEERATVTLEYLPGPGQGEKVTQVLEIPPLRRETVNVNQVVGPEKDVSVRLTSDRPVVAERPMYFSYRGEIKGGHNVMGAPAPAHSWFFAEGTTRQGFEEWLCIANPGEERATVTLEYLPGPGQGEKVTQVLEVPPLRRETVNVNQVVGPEKDVSVRLTSDRPVVAERPMYFSYGKGWKGGSCELGFDP